MLACCFVDRSHWSSHSPAPRFANGAGSLGNILDALIHHDASSNLAAGLMFMTHDVNVIKDHLVLQETGRFSAEMSSFKFLSAPCGLQSGRLRSPQQRCPVLRHFRLGDLRGQGFSPFLPVKGFLKGFTNGDGYIWLP